MALSAVLGAGVAGASPAERDPAAGIRAFLDGNGSPQPLCETPEGRAVWSVTQAFYAARERRPAWLDDDGQPTGTGRRLVQLLDRADRDGLDASALGLVSAHGPAPDDVRWTVAFLQYASVLGQGAVGPASVPFWRPVRRSVDLAALLRRAADGDAEDALDSVRPWHPQHARLAEALARYRALAAREAGTLVVPARLRLRPGQKSPVVPHIRERLVLEGDLGADDAAPSDVFDPTVAAGLRRFEARHGLAADGRLDADVAAALSVPLGERVRQIALNLERWRWAPPSEGRSVLINIPTFTLHAYDDGREAVTMRVITGQSDTPTPVFSQHMNTVVFSPYWNVPTNIAANETLPAVLRDRDYLRRMGLEVVRDGRVLNPASINWRGGARNLGFRQRPGAGNALGLVKFLFPNPFNVYVHDTPEDWLFARARRTFSHGCIRVEKPEELARWVLEGHAGWTPRTIAAAMRSGRERGVPLGEPIPLTIGYFTVWVDDAGAVRFLPDVYSHDRVQASLL